MLPQLTRYYLEPYDIFWHDACAVVWLADQVRVRAARGANHMEHVIMCDYLEHVDM